MIRMEEGSRSTIVIIKRIHRLAIKLIRRIAPLGAQVIHFVAIWVIMVEKRLSVLHCIAIVLLHARGGEAHCNNSIRDIWIN